jgi:UDP:flavonoid glycosyltransferase YjiC (YdhE family)
MRIGFITPPVPGHLNPMTTLARQLQSRGHDVVYIGLTLAGPAVCAAHLPFVPCAEKELATAVLPYRAVSRWCAGRIDTDFPWERLTEEPLIYASMGTVQNGLANVFRAIWPKEYRR